MAELAAELGMTMELVLAGTGLNRDQLSQPNLLVSAQQELQVIRNLVARLGDRPALGIRAGTRYHFTAFGALGFAVVSSRTMRSALDVALQHFHLTFAFTRFVVSDEDNEICVLLADEEVPVELAQFIVERDISALITVARDLYDLEPVLSQVTFKGIAPADLSAYEAFFRVRPEFGAAVNCVKFDRALFYEHLPRANELAHAAALDQCRQLLEARKARSGMASLVRDRLLTAAGQMPTMNDISASLCMTTRTLRRRLLNEGTTFAELRDEVRMTLADELLAGPQLSIPQIAERLGYAEPTSFINAFKRWHGKTPHAFRMKKTE